MFKVVTKRHIMNTIAQEMLAMNTTISSFATKLPDQYEFLLSYFYRFDKQVDSLKDYINFLYREMDYEHNQFSQREILEIYISFSRLTLLYMIKYVQFFVSDVIELV